MQDEFSQKKALVTLAGFLGALFNGSKSVLTSNAMLLTLQDVRR
jgi:hypothetical protein